MMKIKEEVKETVIKNLKGWLSELNMKILTHIREMEKSDTMERFMKIKKSLLSYYVRNIPISASYCPFCVLKRKEGMPCSRCPYAKIHGECSSFFSDYHTIRDISILLANEIDRRYFKEGEEYLLEGEK